VRRRLVGGLGFGISEELNDFFKRSEARLIFVDELDLAFICCPVRVVKTISIGSTIGEIFADDVVVDFDIVVEYAILKR